MIDLLQITFISACAGLVYGCSFVLQQRSIFNPTHATTHRIKHISFFLARILVLCFTGRYLLRSAVIPSILGAITFFSMFWVILLAVRAYAYERV